MPFGVGTIKSELDDFSYTQSCKTLQVYQQKATVTTPEEYWRRCGETCTGLPKDGFYCEPKNGTEVGQI